MAARLGRNTDAPLQASPQTHPADAQTQLESQRFRIYHFFTILPGSSLPSDLRLGLRPLQLALRALRLGLGTLRLALIPLWLRLTPTAGPQTPLAAPKTF